MLNKDWNDYLVVVFARLIENECETLGSTFLRLWRVNNQMHDAILNSWTKPLNKSKQILVANQMVDQVKGLE